MTARGDARKRQASPISMHSDAHNGLTDAEREELWLVEHAPIEATYTAVARIKAAAVQAERERLRCDCCLGVCTCGGKRIVVRGES